MASIVVFYGYNRSSAEEKARIEGAVREEADAKKRIGDLEVEMGRQSAQMKELTRTLKDDLKLLTNLKND